ncbi:MAG: OmpL47-type beta-barrel domain-containing protein [Bacilli bacterium]
MKTTTYVQSVTVEISSNDLHSGIKELKYKLIKDGVKGSYIDVTKSNTSVTLDSNGTYKLEVKALDKVGNIVTIESGEYKIDSTSLTITFSPSGQETYVNKDIKVEITPEYELSAVAY